MVVEGRQGLRRKGCRGNTVFEEAAEDLVAVEFDKLGRDEGFSEFLGQQFRVGVANAKGDHCAGVAKHGLPHFRSQLINVLVRERQTEAILASFSQNGCKAVGLEKLAEERNLAFAPADLMNLPVCSALARIGPRDHSFTLETRLVPPSERPLNEAYAEALAETRKRYCTPSSSIREELAELRKTIPTGKGEDPFSKLSRQQKQEREDRQKGLGEEPTVESPLGQARKEAPAESHAGEARSDEPTAAKPAADDKLIKIGSYIRV